MALKQDGSYYLAYQLMPTPQQLRRSYPEFDSFVDLKRKHDPNGMFESAFHRHYAGAGR